MPESLDLLRAGRHQELWDKHCRFLDLNVDQVMDIQRRLLMEQVKLLADCELGRELMPNGAPRNVDEFRDIVPVTTYCDYAPVLLEKREDGLPAKPMYWQRTSGRSSDYPFKWVPVTERMYREQCRVFLGVNLLAACNRRGDVAIEEHDKVLFGVASPPYTTGYWARSLVDSRIFDFLPPYEEAIKMEFQERTKRGFEMAIVEGLDVFFGIASVLVAIGESLGQKQKGGSVGRLLSRPTVLARLIRALLKSKLAGRPLLPRDLWRLKGMITGGGDTSIYRERIKEMWGRYPLEVFGASEIGLAAVQSWDYQGLSFIPEVGFFEFLPLSERQQIEGKSSGQPRTRLLDEVNAGEIYELVATNFYGGAFVRYRTGDLIRITGLRNEATGANVPQMMFHSRAGDVIELAGFATLTEKLIWRAIENARLPYRDWSATKEAGDKPMLRLYIEMRDSVDIPTDQQETAVHRELAKLDSDYADIESMLGYVPLRVTKLAPGSFANYTAQQQAAGADLAHLKPPHMLPPQEVMDALLDLSRV